MRALLSTRFVPLLLAAAFAAGAATFQTAAGDDGKEAIGDRRTFLEARHNAAAFRSMERLFPMRVVARGERASELARAEAPLRVRYQYAGVEYDLDQFFDRTMSTGLLVLHGDRVLHERYGRGANADSRFLSMSIAKSFTSTLVGLALRDDRIASLEDPVDRYLPELGKSGYAGVSIRHLLQMSSGIDFDEEYGDQGSDIGRLFGAAVEQKDRFNEVAATFGRRSAPGSVFYYASVDTQVLGMLVERTTGKRLADFLSERIWKPLGMEHDALFLLDREGDGGTEMAFGGLNATLRDYGRFGLLMARAGQWQGEQLLPAGWVAEATQPQSAQVGYGKLYPDYPLGYGYQWWLLPGSNGAFTGQGVFGQFLLVDPTLDVVMVKTSAWPTFWVSEMERETYALFDAIVREVAAATTR